MTRAVKISAPSRLHFGLLRFRQTNGDSFGGLGMMIDQPRVEVEIQTAKEWQAVGPQSNRALAFAQAVYQSHEHKNQAPLHLCVEKLPPAHSGLGTGTQLAFAVAFGIRQLFDLPSLTADQLAKSVGRGDRSAVGSHGFMHGGLIWETGQQQPGTLGTLSRRLAVPSDWRILLIRLPEGPGIHGDQERAAFSNLPPIPDEVTENLQRIAEQTVLPAIENADFDSFAQGIYDYGTLSGNCFASVQGGPFSSPAISELVSHLRNHGIQGVGQSSWGPTVFAFVKNKTEATALFDHLKQHQDFSTAEITITRPDNNGANQT